MPDRIDAHSRPPYGPPPLTMAGRNSLSGVGTGHALE